MFQTRVFRLFCSKVAKPPSVFPVKSSKVAKTRGVIYPPKTGVQWFIGGGFDVLTFRPRRGHFTRSAARTASRLRSFGKSLAGLISPLTRKVTSFSAPGLPK